VIVRRDLPFFINLTNLFIMPNNLKSSSAKEKKLSRKPIKAKNIASDSLHSTIHRRILTVSSRYRPSESQMYYKGPGTNVPFLRISGRWLEEAGFPIDCKVDVIVDNNLLIIKPVEV
ncbi:MAG: type I toxin-antitoxin system SymE family toxin, partial [Tannerellaceae bacterium]|nr:type I toxin-antitoxin system SymE family toxin [Tannerellaceae bacterium]